MSFSENFVRSLSYPLLLAYRGESEILRQYRRLRKFWTVSPDELESHRRLRLQQLVQHASQTSPFYQERFAEAGLDRTAILYASDLRKLPCLTKTELNSQMSSVLSTAFRREDLVESSTGGSSGIPLKFYRDAHVTAVRRAQDFFFNAQLGIHPGTKRAWVWGSPLDIAQSSSIKARLANFLSERAVHFYSFDAGDQQLREFIGQLNRHRPEAIFAYPNMLVAILEFARAHDVTLPRVGKVITTAEPTYSWQRELFREMLGAETFERYGSREIGTVAAELLDHNGMYVFEPTYILEVIDGDGNEVRPGEMGELVVTDLYNFAMPLIRYRTGDMVRLEAPGNTSCWRRITAVGGRVVDLIVRPDGSRIAGEALIMALRTSGVVDRVQVIQRNPQLFVIRHLETASIGHEVRERLQAKIETLMTSAVTIEFQAVPELGYDPSGKYRYVTSECRRDR